MDSLRFAIYGLRKSKITNHKPQIAKKMGAGSYPHSHYPLSIINYPLLLHHFPHGHALRNGDTKRIDTL